MKHIAVSNSSLKLNYILSNASLAIYLDALEIAKQNAYPKVSYNIKICDNYRNIFQNAYNNIGQLLRINDNSLKLQNVKGYVSGITLDLDEPEEDSIEIKNYKTKFEDLFSTITAQTEAMKKNGYNLNMLSNVITSSGDISSEVLQSSIMKVDLNYAFNNGKLTIDEKNGIWGTSDTGVVAFRGGGIFTATEKNADDTWKWNTGITPEGINADLITSGQLDTNLIKIYAGDHLRFQMNGDGIFAYKSWMDDVSQENAELLKQTFNEQALLAKNSIDPKQYVVFNDAGLSLIAKKGALVLNKDKTEYKTVLENNSQTDQIVRVEISWNGLVLRNWENERVFYADPDTGNLTISGRIEANDGHIGAWEFNAHRIWSESQIITIDETTQIYNTYVALNSGGSIEEEINGQIVNTTPYAFWAGNASPEQASLYIRKDGFLKANSGLIGGWNIQSDRLYSSQISLSSVSSIITSSSISSKPTYSTTVGEDETATSTITPSIVTTNGVQEYAQLWVHGNNSNEAAYAKCYITNYGHVMATEFYIIKHDSNGRVQSVQALSDLINYAADIGSQAYQLVSSIYYRETNDAVIFHLPGGWSPWVAKH